MKKILNLILIATLLSACSLPTHSLEEVETTLAEHGLVLEEINLPRNNAFIRELNDILPKAYSLEGRTLSIYIFPTANHRKKGMKAFEKANTLSDLEAHKVFKERNVLVFYVEGKEETYKKISDALKQL